MGLRSILCVLLAVSLSWAEECVREEGDPSCVCRIKEGIIDLRPLANTDGTPRFSDAADSNGFFYSYNPCYAYTKGTCKDSYICQWSNDPNGGFSIADNGTEVLTSNGNGTSLIKYASSNPIAGNGAQVFVQCDQSLSAEKSSLIVQESVALTFSFELTSCQACIGGCKGGNSGSIAGLVGLVLIILVLVALLVYCISGAIFLKIRNSDDKIPNQAFWLDLPVLVKGGCVFIVSPCVKLGEKDGYSSI